MTYPQNHENVTIERTPFYPYDTLEKLQEVAKRPFEIESTEPAKKLQQEHKSPQTATEREHLNRCLSVPSLQPTWVNP